MNLRTKSHPSGCAQIGSVSFGEVRGVVPRPKKIIVLYVGSL